ncbi:MAG: ribosomal-processing cysteine protease Prp [Clostridia bacterium]|nr:ribosomal-processing cysteine protease Prp [Clostridia bacterium]
MIYARFLKNKNDKLLGFDFSGHAGDLQAGQNIVCAAVSSVAFMVANSITEVCKVEAKISLSDDGRLALLIEDKDFKSCESLLYGLLLHLENLQSEYENEISVSYVEV